ncbi:hypothetical protein TL16_g12189 [Triparma laevis f. inornata]|uniref:Uncharacterized protein n=2 Tax=Triparma laevis TaxID=1534972 RepID=A0A9W7A6Q9_9STRA|nr:hypothetical protein TrLO_g6540 [Triparma laevis f. longispina]GMH91904.1 hypothetical protein TL16_g12189 [Triparma laevis f. inornata]
MNTKISIHRSQNRNQIQSPDALKRRQTRRSIVDAYLGGEQQENPASNPKLERSESSQSTRSRDSSTASTSDLRPPPLDTSVESSKTWSGTASKAMYNSIPSFNSPKSKQDQPRLGYFGFSSPSNVNTSPTSLGPDDDDSAGTPLPQSPTRQSGSGSAFGLSALSSPLKLFTSTSPTHLDKMEPGQGPNAPVLPPEPPILFASTTEAMLALKTGLPSDAVNLISPSHVATGFALGASAAVLLANGGNAGNIGKAVAFGGVAGAGSVYGLNAMNSKLRQEKE